MNSQSQRATIHQPPSLPNTHGLLEAASTTRLSLTNARGVLRPISVQLLHPKTRNGATITPSVSSWASQLARTPHPLVRQAVWTRIRVRPMLVGSPPQPG